MTQAFERYVACGDWRRCHRRMGHGDALRAVRDPGVPAPRQKVTTTCVVAPADFVSKVFWPQALEKMAVFERARRAMAEEIVTAWLGAAGDQVFVVDEEPRR